MCSSIANHTAKSVIDNFKSIGVYTSKPRPGRPSKLAVRERRKLRSNASPVSKSFEHETWSSIPVVECDRSFPSRRLTFSISGNRFQGPERILLATSAKPATFLCVCPDSR
ncbi:hypothetical protein TNCV_4618731 [Trichonephila clavipes]|nr:hypothetical protein TNCV_4618731 [Trichonephila clavipes]